MAKKIQVTRYGIVHYHAGCNQCNFTAAIQGNQHEREKDVRAKVYQHIRKTGHECWIECGTHTLYNLENSKAA